MLVGSGGVLALILGAWSVLWALWALPGAAGRGSWPVVVAFLAGMLGLGLAGSFEEPLVAMAGVIREPHEAREAALAEVRGMVWRPLLAAGLGAAGLGLAGAASRRLSAEVAPFELQPDRAERSASLAAGGLAAAGLVLLAAFASTLSAVEPDLSSVVDHVARLQTLARFGLGVAALLVGDAAAVGLWRWWRIRAA